MREIVTNRLGAETSPYLRQHAHNPVHWQPWDADALALARENGKPILLSIGYSACHWCHVMARECFEDPAIAERMNALFVNIKVDREERPDLDHIYQRAHLLIQQRSGGWPLTMFLTPQTQLPFFGGTYFPPVARHGLPGFVDVLERVAAFHRTRGDELTREGTAIVAALERLDAGTQADGDAGTAAPHDGPLEAARAVMAANYDTRHGGFGNAPKFPHTGMLAFLLESWAASRDGSDREEDAQLRTIVLHSLERMGLGGLYDHLGGGFFRYSVDDAWGIPHFEKMLYDNGPLLGLYARAARLCGDERFAAIARETGHWLLAQMQAAGGGYFATVDADSEGEEGAFYLWRREEVECVLTDATTRRVAERVLGLDRSPNFEDKWHLQVVTDPQEAAGDFGLTADEAQARLAAARAALGRARARRVPPPVDDKVLTAWNGLAIRGMAQAARALEEPAFEASATHAVDFVREALWRDGRLLAVHREGVSRFQGYLDDHALLGLGLLDLLAIRWRARDLDFATALANALLAHFEDKQRGGFYFTAHDHEPLIHRPKPLEDASTPAGNGAAVELLARLGYLLGRTDYLEAAERALRAGWHALEQHPHACAAMLAGLREYRMPTPVVVLRGEAGALASWQRQARQVGGWQHLERAFMLAIPREVGPAELPEVLRGRAPTEAPVTAWVCHGTRCAPPAGTPAEVAAALADARSAHGP